MDIKKILKGLPQNVKSVKVIKTKFLKWVLIDETGLVIQGGFNSKDAAERYAKANSYKMYR